MTCKNRLSVNLSDGEAAELGALAERAKVSKAWLGRYAIAQLLERTSGQELQLPLGLTEPRQGRN